MKKVSAVVVLAIVLEKKEEIKMTELYNLSDVIKTKGLLLRLSYKEIMEAIKTYPNFFRLSNKVGESAVKRSPKFKELFNASNFLEDFMSDLSNEERDSLRSMF